MKLDLVHYEILKSHFDWHLKKHWLLIGQLKFWQGFWALQEFMYLLCIKCFSQSHLNIASFVSSHEQKLSGSSSNSSPFEVVTLWSPVVAVSLLAYRRGMFLLINTNWCHCLCIWRKTQVSLSRHSWRTAIGMSWSFGIFRLCQPH